MIRGPGASSAFSLAITAGFVALVASGAGATKRLGAETPTAATKINSKDGLTYVWIPKGRFTMGCSQGDADCTDLEKPPHEVIISSGFWIGQTEVTQEAYRHVVGNNPSQFQGDKLPVERIRWEEAAAYCRMIGGRLPTEAEWEFAARAGSTQAGSADISEFAWFQDDSGGRTHEVGQKKPNSWGLYDTLGNVWEWVADWFAPSYPGRHQKNPHGPATTQVRTIRGGAWYDEMKFIRSSYRTGVAPNFAGNVGIRCVLDQAPR